MTADPDPVTEAQYLGGWGDLLDPNIIHDFVWTGDDE